MIGTLTASITGISLRPPSFSTGGTSKAYSGKFPITSVLHAPQVMDQQAAKSASLYNVLRVERNASVTEIKTAYRTLAKVYHPDAYKKKSISDCEFIDIRNAYETLSDPVARETYDMKWRVRCTAVVGDRRGYRSGRRWETDQCW